MHTFDGKSCRIHFNSDMSGDIHIWDKDSDKEIKVDGQDILDFVANHVRNEKISKLEQMGTREILGGIIDV